MTFETPSILLSDSSLRLETKADFGTSFFDVFFNAYFTVNNGQVKPVVNIPGNPVIPGNPIFPSGSFQLDFAASSDPPFTIEIFVLDPNLNRGTFTDVTVPEPSTLVIWSLASGVFSLVGLRIRLKHPMAA